MKSIVLEAISLYNCNERRRRRTSNQVCNLCVCCVLGGGGRGLLNPMCCGATHTNAEETVHFISHGTIVGVFVETRDSIHDYVYIYAVIV